MQFIRNQLPISTGVATLPASALGRTASKYMTIELIATRDSECITLRATGQMTRVHIVAALVRLEHAFSSRPSADLVLDCSNARTLQSDSLWHESLDDLVDTCPRGTRIAYVRPPDMPRGREASGQRIARNADCQFKAFENAEQARHWVSACLEQV
jgi:hypothetical protein